MWERVTEGSQRDKDKKRDEEWEKESQIWEREQ